MSDLDEIPERDEAKMAEYRAGVAKYGRQGYVDNVMIRLGYKEQAYIKGINTALKVVIYFSASLAVIVSLVLLASSS